MVDSDAALAEPVEQLEHARTVDAGVVPDPADQREIEPFQAALGKIGAGLAPVPNASADRPPQARRPWHVEEDRGVDSIEAWIVEPQSDEVPIHDPARRLRRRSDGGTRLVERGGLPTRSKEERVEVHDRQAGALREQPCEPGLAGAARAQDYDAFDGATVAASTSSRRSTSARSV